MVGFLIHRNTYDNYTKKGERAAQPMSNISMTDAELLKYAIENGILDTALVQEKIEMQRRKELLNKHPYRIWEDKNGIWHTYFPDDIKGRIHKKRNSKEKIEEIVIEFWKNQADDPKIKDVFDEWIDSKLELKEISIPTHQRYKADYKRYYSEFGERKIKNISELDIEDFLRKSIAEKELTSKSFSNLRTITFGIFKRAKKKKYVDFSITQLLNDMEISKNAFRKVIKEDYEEVFLEDEYDIMLHYLQENPDVINLGLLLIFATGLRVGELVALKWTDIDDIGINIRRTESTYKDENNKEIHVVKDYPKSAAGVRTAIIPKDYSWIIKKLRVINPFGEYVFLKNGKRVITKQVRRRLDYLCEKLSIYKKSPHKIRKTYGSILLDNNIDKNLILGQMGHADIICTEQHYHRNRKSDMKKSMILSNVPELMAK